MGPRACSALEFAKQQAFRLMFHELVDLRFQMADPRTIADSYRLKGAQEGPC